MKLASKFFAATLALALSPIAYAQAAPATPKPAADSAAAKPSTEAPSSRVLRCADPSNFTERTFYLTNATQQMEQNEIVTALRNMLDSCDKVYLVFDQSAIIMNAPTDQIAFAQKLINDLDRPKKNYRLTYTVSEMDGSKQIGAQHFTMILTSGQDTVLKLGSKIPIATGAYSGGGGAANAGMQTSFTYIDVGMNFAATLTEMGEYAMLKSDVAQTSAQEKTTIEGVQEPIVRQAEVKGESVLTPGKPVVLGSMDMPGSTSRTDIEVVMQPLP